MESCRWLVPLFVKGFEMHRASELVDACPMKMSQQCHDYFGAVLSRLLAVLRTCAVMVQTMVVKELCC